MRNRWLAGVRCLVAGGLALCSGYADALTMYVQPKFVFTAPNVAPNLFEDTASAAFADANSVISHCDSGGTCWNLQNLHFAGYLGSPYNLQFDGTNAYMYFDEQICSPVSGGTTCNVSQDWNFVQTNIICPISSGGQEFITGRIPMNSSCVPSRFRTFSLHRRNASPAWAILSTQARGKRFRLRRITQFSQAWISRALTGVRTEIFLRLPRRYL